MDLPNHTGGAPRRNRAGGRPNPGSFPPPLLNPAMASVPLYLSIRAYRRAGGRRLLNLAAALAFLFAGQAAPSLFMDTGTTLYVSDIPLDHLLHFASLVFFTAVLLEGRP